MRGMRILSAFIISAVALVATLGAAAPPLYSVHALRFASAPYDVKNLVAGATAGRSIDIAFTIWIVRGGGKTILVDAGFYRDKFIQQWKPVGYSRPSDALMATLGIKPEDVTDIIVTHSHWDHMDGADLFPRAKIWIQGEEYRYYVGENGTRAHSGGADVDDAAMLFAMNAAGRVNMIDGDAKEVLPGVSVYTGGKHTFASQFVGVATSAGTVVLASDNAYLYENLENKLAIAQTLDAASNVAAQARMLALAASPRFVIPGHDPAVFTRFPVSTTGVAEIVK